MVQASSGFGFSEFDVSVDHHADEIFERNIRLPPERRFCFCRGSSEYVDLRRPEQLLVYDDIVVPIQVHVIEGAPHGYLGREQELFNTMLAWLNAL